MCSFHACETGKVAMPSFLTAGQLRRGIVAFGRSLFTCLSDGCMSPPVACGLTNFSSVNREYGQIKQETAVLPLLGATRNAGRIWTLSRAVPYVWWFPTVMSQPGTVRFHWFGQPMNVLSPAAISEICVRCGLIYG